MRHHANIYVFELHVQKHWRRNLSSRNTSSRDGVQGCKTPLLGAQFFWVKIYFYYFEDQPKKLQKVLKFVGSGLFVGGRGRISKLRHCTTVQEVLVYRNLSLF